MRIISIVNKKGGVGKTTTSINLSSALAHLGYKVLLMDLDPQGNSGTGLGFDPMGEENTLFEALIGKCTPTSVIKPCDDPNLFLMMSNLKLSSLETYCLANGIKKPKFLLNNLIKKLSKKNYDFIILDTPPSLGLLTQNALTASNSIIIPVQCEYFALQSVSSVLSMVSNIQKNENPSLQIDGFLLTMYDPRISLQAEIGSQIRSLFKEGTFVTSIPRNSSIPEASYRGLAVTSFRPKAQGSRAYFALAREVLDRRN